MKHFVHVLLMACLWREGYYVAFQSNGSQYYMDVFTKEAANLASAMSTTSSWVEQPYQIPWTRVLYYVFRGACRMELTLWTNDYEGKANHQEHLIRNHAPSTGHTLPTGMPRPTHTRIHI